MRAERLPGGQARRPTPSHLGDHAETNEGAAHAARVVRALPHRRDGKLRGRRPGGCRVCACIRRGGTPLREDAQRVLPLLSLPQCRAQLAAHAQRRLPSRSPPGAREWVRALPLLLVVRQGLPARPAILRLQRVRRVRRRRERAHDGGGGRRHAAHVWGCASAVPARRRAGRGLGPSPGVAELDYARWQDLYALS